MLSGKPGPHSGGDAPPATKISDFDLVEGS